MFSIDTLLNLVSSLGNPVKDKVLNTSYQLVQLGDDQLEYAFRGDWVARKIVCVPPFDMTREWRGWMADKDTVEKIEAEEMRLGLQHKVRTALTRARLYGGAGLVLGVDQGSAEQELRVDQISKGQLKYVNCVGRQNLTSGPLQLNASREYYGEPEYYEVRGASDGIPVRVHPSRVVRFVGAPFPDEQMRSSLQNTWGDSVLLALNDAIVNVGLTTHSIAQLVSELKIDVIKIPDLMNNVETAEYRNKILQRFQLANVGKSTVNALLMDSNEEWQRISASMTGVTDVLRLYIMVAAAAADIPATRLAGQSPVGMNSTGESDTRNYYDRLASEQKVDLSASLYRLDEVMLRSTLGTRDPSISYFWRPLWQMDKVQAADVALKKAQAFQVDVQSGVMDLDALREGRQNQLVEDEVYPGFEQALEEETPLPEDPAVGTAGPEPQRLALNGAQISSLASIVQQVAGGQLPAESAKAIIVVGFPSLSKTEVNAVIDPLSGFKQLPAPIPSPPGAGASPPAAVETAGGSNVVDARPRTLYVRRDVRNADTIVAWAEKQGFENIVPADEMHVTVLYSKQPVDWMKMGSDGEFSGEADLTVPAGGPRVVEPLGDKGAVVLMFVSSRLCWRHEAMCAAGASHDYENYVPHMTISYRDAGVTVEDDAVEPYRGPIELGPEIFEEIKSRAPHVGNYDEDQPRDKGDKWSSSGGGGVASIPSVIKGSSAERVAMRKLLKDPKLSAEQRHQIKGLIAESFKKHRAAALAKGDHAKAAELENKLSKMGPQYTTPALSGPAKPLSGELNKLAVAGGAQAGSLYTPEQTAHFKTLSEISGPQSAKEYIYQAKNKLNSNPSMKADGMTPELAAHVVAYSGSAYKTTNDALRAGVLNEHHWEHVKSLNAALSKLPDHVGTVYRKADLSPSTFALYTQGKIVEERAFTSTSKSASVWSGLYKYEIQSKTGKDISRLSNHPNEQEVLFGNGTRFRVAGVQGKTIRLQEV